MRIVTRSFRPTIFQSVRNSVWVTYQPTVCAQSTLSSRLSNLSINSADQSNSARIFTICNSSLLIYLNDVYRESLRFYHMILSTRAITTSTSTARTTRRLFRRIKRFTTIIKTTPMNSSTLPILMLTVLLLLNFRLINIFPIFSVLIVFLPFLQITRRLVNFVCFLGLTIDIQVVQIRIKVMFPHGLFMHLFSIILQDTFICSRGFMVVCVNRVCVYCWIYFFF